MSAACFAISICLLPSACDAGINVIAVPVVSISVGRIFNLPSRVPSMLRVLPFAPLSVTEPLPTVRITSEPLVFLVYFAPVILSVSVEPRL